MITGAPETDVNADRESFAASAMFDKLFDEGMALVQETALYLDGRGRTEAQSLPHNASMLYAGESMRVTTRLMQAASWLLVQRAVQEGEMSAEDAGGERYRLGSKDICLGGRSEGLDTLPVTLRDLLARSDRLYRRVERLDQTLTRSCTPATPVKSRLDLLEQAFAAPAT